MEISIIAFVHRLSGLAGRRIQKALRGSGLNSSCHFYDSFEAFSSFLHHRHYSHERDRELYVLLADTPERLKRFGDFEKELRDRWFLLVLPDDHRVTITQGHELRPRYVTTVGGGFDDVVAVLHKKRENIDAKMKLYRRLG